ncbi:MAG TPA: isoprenylcysteine carboxylmethyltransferase family protein [Rhizomicrobium sp.]|nr:isoprenylcysteine carboxylmethyltransferase family protein [Rhizomicrobium sp.]
MDTPANPVVHSRAYDLLFAAPLAATYGFVVVGDVLLIRSQWSSHMRWQELLAVAGEIATLTFFGLQTVLLLTRRLPVAKSDGIWPRAAALLGANFNFALLLLPRVVLSGPWLMASSVLSIVGTCASALVLVWLGRAFSIFPEARAFVTKGPYRFVRHPLYLTEFVATLGIMLGYRQPWGALVTAVTFYFQLQRMTREEAVLRQAYPPHAEYSQRTARLIPGIY